MHQVDYWLYPLLALSLVSLITRLSLPIRWSWGFIIQALPIIALATFGLYNEPKWVYALAGWVLVIAFFLPSKLFYSAMQRNLTELNAQGMRKIAGYVHFFFWGMAGEFWRDMCLAMAFYIEQNGEDGEALINRWIKKEDLPKPVRGLPYNYKKIGNSVMWRWQPIIDEFERLPEENQKKLSNSILIPTARAYAELGRFSDAARCIEISKLRETMVPMNYLALSLLPFFSMTGAFDKVSSLLEVLRRSSSEFTQSSKYYWLGRCYRAMGKKEDALASFDKAREFAKTDVFLDRLDKQKKLIEEGCQPIDNEAVKPYVERVWSVFKQSAYTQELLSPQRKSIAIIVLIAIMVMVHIVKNSFEIPVLNTMLNPNFMLSLYKSVHNTYALNPEMFIEHGQYYRLFTYLFLHAHITHMIFNIVGLIWFGRICENIFGTSRFLAIYIVGGILSGVAHAFLNPELHAVGASGAVMAVFGAVAIGIFRLKNKIPESIWKFKLGLLGGLAMFQIILDQLIPHVAVFAHLGGLLAGLAFGAVLSIRSPNTDRHEITGQYVSG